MRNTCLPAVLAGTIVFAAAFISTYATGQEQEIDLVTAARAIPTSTKIPATPTQALLALQSKLHVKSGTEFFKGASYVGAEACAACHKEQFSEWKNTWHAKMEQKPTKETVIGKFDGVPVTYKNIKVESKDGKRNETVTFQVIPFQKDGGYYFTVVDQDDAGNNQTFKIEKTLGGKWDQGYEVLIGDNYYPAPLRHSNSGGGDWLVKSFHPQFWIEPDGTKDGRPRAASELPMGRVAEAKCAGCHTTGYTFKKDEKTKVWKATGDGQLGVGCEKCHGPGSKHIEAAKTAQAAGKSLEPGATKIVHGLKDLDFQQQNQLCAQCHGRSSNRSEKGLAFPQGYLPGNLDITEKLVFWNYQSTANPKQAKYFYRNNWAKRNRQQWQDHILSAHYTKAGHSCLTCHTVHGKWENMQLRQKPQAMCTGCHTAEKHAARPQTEMYEDSKMSDAGVMCTDCHMARIGFRSHLTTRTEGSKDYPMDGSAHHYLVPTPAIKKAYGTRTACEVCHTKGRKMPPTIDSWVNQHSMTDDELHAKLTTIQTETRRLVDHVRNGLKAVAPSNSDHVAMVESARAKLNFVLLDGSMGFHNGKKAKTMLEEALALLRDAGYEGPSQKVASFEKRDGNSGTQPPQLQKITGSKPAPTTAALTRTVPTAPPANVKFADEPRPGTWYKSKPGDILWKVARRAYGSGARFTVIYEANKQRLPKGPDVLEAGTALWLP